MEAKRLTKKDTEAKIADLKIYPINRLSELKTSKFANTAIEKPLSKALTKTNWSASVFQ